MLRKRCKVLEKKKGWGGGGGGNLAAVQSHYLCNYYHHTSVWTVANLLACKITIINKNL